MMRDQKGLTLIEVVIAVALFGIIAGGLFMALNVSHKATDTTDRLTTAESLTRSELEYIKACDYDDSGYPSYGDPNGRIPPGYPGYSITEIVVPINPDTYQALLPGEDQGIQKIT
ncbi:MAG: prepilin-type N-terminal cleavage/methylation domain-containing protein, partial [Dehalococcoidia bacterium]